MTFELAVNSIFIAGEAKKYIQQNYWQQLVYHKIVFVH